MAKIDLTKYGITGTTEIVYNPSYDVLFDELYCEPSPILYSSRIISGEYQLFIPQWDQGESNLIGWSCWSFKYAGLCDHCCIHLSQME